MSNDLLNDDDIARLFADANPVPKHGRATGYGLAVADDAGLGQVAVDHDTSIDVVIGLDERPAAPTGRLAQHPRRWLLAAAAMALVVGAAIATLQHDDPANVGGAATTEPQITTPDTLPPTRLRVVEDFVAALSAYDVAAVSRLLAPGAVPALVPGADKLPYGTASIEDQLAWLSAGGSTWELENCREQGEIGAYCTARERNRLSDLIELEMPVTMLFGFENGRIDRLVLTTDRAEFGPKAFVPFYEWLVAHHPDDVERLWMPVDRGTFASIVTQDAAELADTRLTEYIAAYTADRAPAVVRFLERVDGFVSRPGE